MKRGATRPSLNMLVSLSSFFFLLPRGCHEAASSLVIRPKKEKRRERERGGKKKKKRDAKKALEMMIMRSKKKRHREKKNNNDNQLYRMQKHETSPEPFSPSPSSSFRLSIPSSTPLLFVVCFSLFFRRTLHYSPASLYYRSQRRRGAAAGVIRQGKTKKRKKNIFV